MEKITQSKENKINLEAIFHTVDLIKLDLNNCGNNLQEFVKYSKIQLLTAKNGFLKCLSGFPETVIIKTVTYKYFPITRELKRKVDGGKDDGSFETLLSDVSNFNVTYFPDCNSVLYRIDIDKEVIRGYIFLNSLVRKESEKYFN